MTKISVCMATYNGEKYLHRQLESILTQLGPEDEVIISDDSSTDDTVGIIRGFGDNRVRLFEGNTFYSPIFNLENALRKAKGEIIVLSDQDDIWLDNKIKIIREKFNGKEGSVYLVMLDGYVIDDDGNLTGDSIFQRINAGKGLLKNIYDNTYVGCCLAFTRELLEIALPFPKKIPMHDMWLGLLSELFGMVEFAEEKTIQYRRHQSNVSFRPASVGLQIRRRFFLTVNLMRRYVERQ